MVCGPSLCVFAFLLTVALILLIQLTRVRRRVFKVQSLVVHNRPGKSSKFLLLVFVTRTQRSVACRKCCQTRFLVFLIKTSRKPIWRGYRPASSRRFSGRRCRRRFPWVPRFTLVRGPSLTTWPLSPRCRPMTRRP